MNNSAHILYFFHVNKKQKLFFPLSLVFWKKHASFLASRNNAAVYIYSNENGKQFHKNKESKLFENSILFNFMLIHSL